MPPPSPLPQAHLVRIRPEDAEARFYCLALWPNLFGGVSLAHEWGRIGQPGQLRLDLFATAAEAAQALDRLARRQRQRGYRDSGTCP